MKGNGDDSTYEMWSAWWLAVLRMKFRSVSKISTMYLSGSFYKMIDNRVIKILILSFHWEEVFYGIVSVVAFT